MAFNLCKLDFNNHKVYGAIVNAEDHIIRTDGKPFDPKYYKEHPADHISTFADKVLQQARLLNHSFIDCTIHYNARQWRNVE
jgi:hypothetical protein